MNTAEVEAFKKVMEEKSKEFVEKGAEVYARRNRYSKNYGKNKSISTKLSD